MGLSKDDIRSGLDTLADSEPVFARVIAQVGYPEPRIRDRGYATLLRTIVGQQVSVASANAVWGRLEEALGDLTDPRPMIAAGDETLRGAGLSRQKNGYARSLAALTLSGDLDFDALPDDDETAIAVLTSVKGIGRWSAEIYLLFAEGRADIWPAGDLAVQIAVGKWFGMNERPDEKTVRGMAEAWRPHRGAAAIFAWHSYNSEVI